MRLIPAIVASFIASVLLFLLASYTSVMVETVQPNGLPEIYAPYGWISFVTTLAAFWVLFFGTALSLVFLWRGTAAPRGRPFFGSGLISSGVYAVLLGAFLSLANMEDEGPRCMGGCAASLLRYYQTVYVASTLLAVLGLMAAVYGVRLIIGRTADVPA
jgi:hypothetical protein